jgi:hypothetical protein
MTTRYRFRNKYRLQLRERDHNPVHVHIVGGSVDAAIDLETLQVIQGCLPVWLQQEVIDWLKANRDDLVKEWQTWQQ